jgi:hypothetical protein
MVESVLLAAVLALGQAAPPVPDAAPAAAEAEPAAEAPASVPATLPDLPAAASDAPPLNAAEPAKAAEPPPDQPPAPIVVPAPLLPPPVPPAAPPAAAAAAAAPAPRWLFMKELQGTWEGGVLDGNRMDIYGWTEGSYTYSGHHGVWPMTAQSPTGDFLLNQNWLVFERTVVTSGTTEPTYGFHTAWILPGSDARYTPSRGLLDHQHGVFEFNHSSYPIDLFHAYGEAYFPTIGRGLDVKVGKNAVPYFAETEDKVYNPLFSHSYIFYYGGPFTHTGLQTNLKLTDEWSVENRLVMGSDIAQFYGAQPTYVGALSWTQPGGGRNTALLSVVIDSGRFDVTHHQNNLNLIDLVFVHNFNPVLKYTLDANFGYENNVAGLTVDGEKSATWYGAANYLSYTVSPRLVANGRVEFFNDTDGLRTGFKGLYSALTGGVTFKPRPGLWIRPELRYDYNGESKPYNSDHQPQHGQFSAATDVILRW